MGVNSGRRDPFTLGVEHLRRAGSSFTTSDSETSSSRRQRAPKPPKFDEPEPTKPSRRQQAQEKKLASSGYDQEPVGGRRSRESSHFGRRALTAFTFAGFVALGGGLAYIFNSFNEKATVLIDANGNPILPPSTTASTEPSPTTAVIPAQPLPPPANTEVSAAQPIPEATSTSLASNPDSIATIDIQVGDSRIVCLGSIATSKNSGEHLLNSIRRTAANSGSQSMDSLIDSMTPDASVEAFISAVEDDLNNGTSLDRDRLSQYNYVAPDECSGFDTI